MMRLRLFVLMFLGLFLAACGGQAPASPVTEAASAENVPLAAASPTLLIVTRVPLDTPIPIEGALPVAAPGTLVASETEDPTAGMIFTTIEFIRTGGGTQEQPDSSVRIVINGDGSYSRNGVTGTLSPDRVATINDAITSVNFFGLQGMMLGAAIEGSTDYRYAVTIQRGDLNRTLSSMDGFMPQEYIQLLGVIFEVGLRP